MCKLISFAVTLQKMGKISPNILPNIGSVGILPVVGQIFTDKVGTHIFAHVLGLIFSPTNGTISLPNIWPLSVNKMLVNFL